MKEYHDLDTKKYYHNKMGAEVRILQRHQAAQAVKMFILSSIISVGFATACFALWHSPEVVLNAVDSLKDQGLWPR